MKTLLKIALVQMLLCFILPSVNLELINPLNFSNGYNQEFFETAYIKYDSNSITKHGQFVILSSDNDIKDTSNCLRVVDVTNPRAATVALEIRVNSSLDKFHHLHNTAVWSDPNNDEHTYLAAEIYDNQGVRVQKNPDIYSRVLIFDLSEAITLAKTSDSTPPIISVTDPTTRTAVSLDGNSTGSNHVYIGYIPRDDEYFNRYEFTSDSVIITFPTQIYKMTIDPVSSMLSLIPSEPSQSNPRNENGYLIADKYNYVDLYLMKTIASNKNNKNVNEFVIPSMITKPNGQLLEIEYDSCYLKQRQERRNLIKDKFSEINKNYNIIENEITNKEIDYYKVSESINEKNKFLSIIKKLEPKYTFKDDIQKIIAGMKSK
ncbi:MAG: hypothetical protein HW421_3517 [Ignavibacteria bacterium]|nr:hypothetical protein [Ignavibacteria bacterium]